MYIRHVEEMPIAIAEFDWDHGSREKCRKHGVSPDEIEALFQGDVGVAPAAPNPSGEERFIAVGRTAANRPVFVAFTIREKQGRVLIRPISARYMHRKEIAAYEKESPDLEER